MVVLDFSHRKGVLAMTESSIVLLSKNQGIEIPSHLMEDLHLKDGDRFLLYTEAGVVHLRQLDASAMRVRPLARQRYISEEFLSVVEEWFLNNLKGFEKRMTFQGNLHTMPLAEILLFLSMSRKTGVLILKRDRVTKKVYFENGEIVFAASSLPEERLGDILLQHGKITEAEYHESAFRIEPGKRQGRALVELGVLSPEELWRLVCAQVELIVYSLFEWDGGYFEFLEGDLPTEERIKLRVSISNLVLDGIRRVRDETVYQRYLPEDAWILHRMAVSGDGVDAVHLERAEREVLSCVESGMRVGDCCEKTALSVEETKGILFRLQAAGLIRCTRARAPGEALETEDSSRLMHRIEQCNIIFRLISEFVRTAVGDRVHVILGAFFRGIDHGQDIVFENVSLEGDGSLDPRPLLANVAEYLPAERESILMRGLKELLYFQLFAVRNNLGPEEERQVLAALTEMQFLQ
jgi:hypothetical protein